MLVMCFRVWMIPTYVIDALLTVAAYSLHTSSTHHSQWNRSIEVRHGCYRPLDCPAALRAAH